MFVNHSHATSRYVHIYTHTYIYTDHNLKIILSVHSLHGEVVLTNYTAQSSARYVDALLHHFCRITANIIIVYSE